MLRNSKASFWFKVAVLFLVVVLLVPVLIACGGGDDDDETTPVVTTTSTITPTSTSTQTTTPSPTPAPSGPIKIGIIIPYSGPSGIVGLIFDPVIDLVVEQVKAQGGILGGREIKVIRGDDAGEVAKAAAQAQKLIQQEKVTALLMGGVSGASFDAVGSVAEKQKIPYLTLAGMANLASMKYSAQLKGWRPQIQQEMDHINFLKPKSVATLRYDISDQRKQLDGTEGVPGLREQLKAAGIDLVYEQYFPVAATDFAPYITKIKYMKPDLVLFNPNGPQQAVAFEKQFLELGGYGNMKLYVSSGAGGDASVLKQPGSVGTYSAVNWVAGSPNPGAKAFEDAFRQKYGKAPQAIQAGPYDLFWGIIKAMEAVGTDDPEAVAQYLRSGKLEWDGAWGHNRIDTNGEGEVEYSLVHVQEGGKLVQVWP